MESLAADLRVMQRTPLADAHVRMIRARATERVYAQGQIVTDVSDPMDEFIYVEDGEIEIVDTKTGERAVPSTVGPTQYLGEIAFLNGGVWAGRTRAVVETRVLVVPREEMLALMAEVPEMSDIIVTVFAARRRRGFEDGRSALTVIGAEEDRALSRLVSFARRNRLPMTVLDRDSEEGSRALADAGLDPRRPVALFGHDRVIEDPSPRTVARLLGVDLPLTEACVFDVLIVGGGPAGIAAAVYAGAEGLTALVVEDEVIGGQAGSSSRIENYMGFPTGISGADLCFRGEIQAMRLGTKFAMPRRARLIRRDDHGFCVELDDGETVRARSVVIATGVQYRRLPVDRLAELEGCGIYYAATDLEARLCKGTEVVVIGGGNSAGQAAMYLSRYAEAVHVFVRGDSLASSMSSYLTNRLEKDPSVHIHYQTEMVALSGEEHLQSILCRNNGTGKEWRLDTRAVFVMVGAAPNTGWLEDLVTLDDKGFVCTGEPVGGRSPYETSVPGIFAVGDVRAGSVKRVASGVGEGSVVISSVWNHVKG